MAGAANGIRTLDDLLTYMRSGGDPVLAIACYLQDRTGDDWDTCIGEAEAHAERIENARRDRAEWTISVVEKLMKLSDMPYADAISEAERLYRLEFKVDIKT